MHSVYTMLSLLPARTGHEGTGGSVGLGGILTIVGLWMVFKKAGKPGWAAIIPIYNILVALELIGRPWWWLIVLIIPVANIFAIFLLSFELAKRFGHSQLFGVGLVLLAPIFYLILGFDSSTYKA